MKFAANLSFLFQNVPMLERFALAAKAGFKGVEILFPYAFPARDLAARLSDNGLIQALFNLSPGDWDKGERGLAALPGREDDFRRSVDEALDYASVLGCKTVHCMAGLVTPETAPAALGTYKANLARVADAAATAGLAVTIEPLNKRDMPGYLLTTPSQAERIIADVGKPNLKLQYDLYHAQIMEGDVTTAIRRLAPLIGHVQIASVPDRHEPDAGELDMVYCLNALKDAGYAGWIGCEYRPRGDTLAGLGWRDRFKGIAA